MRRRPLLIALVLGLASLGGVWLASRGGATGPSAFVAGPEGWLGAFRYLEAGRVEASGDEPVRWERPLQAGDGPTTWALAFPWSASGLDVDPATVDAMLREGDTLVVGTSGGLRPGAGEARFLDALGVEVEPVTEDRPPLSPVVWWRWMRRDRELAPPHDASGPTLGVSRARWRARPPANATTWLVDSAGKPAVSSWSVGRGRVILLPAEALSNRRLHREPHRILLATLAAEAPAPWRFDEYHHGWADAAFAGGSGGDARRAWDRLLLQVALIYLVVAWALARRMGPAWRPPRERTGGSGDFLRRLGRLHEELGHAAPAAVVLLERATALDSRVRIGDAQRRLAESADDEDFLRLARSLRAPAAPARKTTSTHFEEESAWTR